MEELPLGRCYGGAHYMSWGRVCLSGRVRKVVLIRGAQDSAFNWDGIGLGREGDQLLGGIWHVMGNDVGALEHVGSELILRLRVSLRPTPDLWMVGSYPGYLLYHRVGPWGSVYCGV